MKNWSGIFDILNPDNTMTFNRLIAHSIGAVETIIYFALISKCRYWEQKNQLIDDEWFFSTVCDLQESTTFGRHQQKKAIDKLIDLGLIKSETKGIPAKRCFMIVDDSNLLYSIIEDGKRISDKIHEQNEKENIKKQAQRKGMSVSEIESSHFCKNYNDVQKIFTTHAESNVKSSTLKIDGQESVNSLLIKKPINSVESSPSKIDGQDRHFSADKSVETWQTCTPKKAVSPNNNLNENNLNENNLSYPINQSKDNFKDLSNSSEKETIDKIDMDRYTKYKELIYSNIDYEDLIAQNESDRNKIDEIVENMLEMLCCTAPSMKISGNEISTEVVHSRVLKIESSHIDYILICLKRNTTKVRNIKAYLRAVIYNAPSTMDIFLDADINNALFSPKLE